jgi:hypothetical protein
MDSSIATPAIINKAFLRFFIILRRYPIRCE